MYLGNVTIKQSTTVSQSIVGNFISPNKTDLIIVKGISKLELIRIERSISSSFSQSSPPLKYETLISLETFSHIRKIAPMKDTFTKKDNFVVLSDSGKLIIFEVDINNKKFIRINQEIYGKTGCRRITPGEYLAIDNKSRAIMIGGIEKEKFVYIFKEIDNNLVLNANFEENKNTNNNIIDNSKKIISSPLEVFTPQHICYDIIALDVGYTNPIFASIEVKYNNMQDWAINNYKLNEENKYQKKLLLYQVEIKNNYVIKLFQHPIDNSAYSLFPIDYEKKNNISQSKSLQGTFLIFCKGFFYLMRIKENKISKEEKYFFEKENKNNNDSIIIINKSVFSSQDKDAEEYNLLCQSQFGDIYHILFKINSKPLEIYNISINLIHKCSPGSTMSVIDNYLYLGKETTDSEIYLISQNKNREENKIVQKINLEKEININSLNSLIDFKYGKYDSSGLPKFFSITGNKDESYLKSLNIKTIYNISTLSNNKIPAQPINIWVLKKNYEDDFDSLVVFSFVNKTLVYEINQIDKSLLELKNNNFFETKLPSLHVSIVKDNSFLQVLPNGILHIKTEKKTTFLKSSSTINCASATNNQLVVGLENKELLYFEFDNSLNKPDIKVIGKKISCVEFCPIDEGIFKSKYIAICIDDSTINILSLEKDKLFFMASTIKIPDNVSSMKIIQNDKHYSHSFMAFVGLTNGVLVMINFSRAPGNTQFQTQIQTKFIGEEELKLFKLNIDGININNNFNNLLYYDSIMICDNKNSFICRLNEKQDNYVDYNIKKINNKEAINIACNCVIKNKETKINENIALIAQKKNIILGRIQHDDISPINIFKLLYNPKAIIPTLNNNFIILETFRELNDDNEKWNSCIQIVNINDNNYTLINEIKFENECITSYHLIENYYSNNDKQLLIIATGENYKLYPIKKYSTAYIYLYDIFLDIKKNYSFTINLKFKDKIQSLSTAVCEYQNKVLSGMYKELILYEIGKEHLLKKSRSNLVKEEIVSLSINGDRILALTRRSSIYVLKYNEFNALFYTIIADDFYTRYIHKVKFLDYDTIVGSDKFENFFIYRIPKDQNNNNHDSGRHAIKDSMTGFMTNSNDSFLHAANLKLVLMNEIHLGEIITEFQTIKIKEDFDNNNEEEENEDNSMSGNNINNSDDEEMDENRIKAILYGTLAGSVGMFIQFNKKEDALFFAQMELLLREYIDEPTGRNILMAKSQYIPVKNIIDFSLIYEYFNIETSLQKKIAEELGDKPVNEIKNKISEIRNLFQ